MVPICDTSGEAPRLELSFEWKDGTTRPFTDAVLLSPLGLASGGRTHVALSGGRFVRIVDEPPREVVKLLQEGGLALRRNDGAVLEKLSRSFPVVRSALRRLTRVHDVDVVGCFELATDDWLRVRVFAASRAAKWQPGVITLDGAVFEYRPALGWMRVEPDDTVIPGLLAVEATDPVRRGCSRWSGRASCDGRIRGRRRTRCRRTSSRHEDEDVHEPEKVSDGEQAFADSIVAATERAARDQDGAVPVDGEAPERAWFELPDPEHVAPVVEWIESLPQGDLSGKRKRGARVPLGAPSGWWLRLTPHVLESLADAWEARPHGVRWYADAGASGLFHARRAVPKVRVAASGMDWFTGVRRVAGGGPRAQGRGPVAAAREPRAVREAVVGLGAPCGPRGVRRGIAATRGPGIGSRRRRSARAAVAAGAGRSREPRRARGVRRVGRRSRDRARAARAAGGVRRACRTCRSPRVSTPRCGPTSTRGSTSWRGPRPSGSAPCSRTTWGSARRCKRSRGSRTCATRDPGGRAVAGGVPRVGHAPLGARGGALHAAPARDGAGERRERAEHRAKVTAHDLVITNYALLRQDIEFWRELPLRAVILDEAQQIKNPSAAVTRAALELRARHRVALTGTPLENRALDLWSIVSFVHPGFLGNRVAVLRALRPARRAAASPAPARRATAPAAAAPAEETGRAGAAAAHRGARGLRVHAGPAPAVSRRTGSRARLPRHAARGPAGHREESHAGARDAHAAAPDLLPSDAGRWPRRLGLRQDRGACSSCSNRCSTKATRCCCSRSSSNA